MRCASYAFLSCPVACGIHDWKQGKSSSQLEVKPVTTGKNFGNGPFGGAASRARNGGDVPGAGAAAGETAAGGCSQPIVLQGGSQGRRRAPDWRPAPVVRGASSRDVEGLGESVLAPGQDPRTKHERESRRDKGNGRRVHAVGGWPLTRGRQGGHRRRAAPGISARRAAARRSTARGIPARTSWRLWRRRWLGIRIHRQRLAVLERLQDLRRDLDGFLDDWLLSRFLARHNRG